MDLSRPARDRGLYSAKNRYFPCRPPRPSSTVQIVERWKTLDPKVTSILGVPEGRVPESSGDIASIGKRLAQNILAAPRAKCTWYYRQRFLAKRCCWGPGLGYRVVPGSQTIIVFLGESIRFDRSKQKGEGMRPASTQLKPSTEQLFDHQIQALLARGYPKMLGMSPRAFNNQLEPLRTKLPISWGLPEDSHLPFVIVINSPLLSAEKALSLIDFKGKSGMEKMYPKKPEDFSTIESVQIPQGLAYLLLDIDRGKESLNLTPANALKTIQAQNRSPLTITEGMAILIQNPEFLKTNNCFSLLASRCGDQRVPALWISEGRPKLGWCWDGNPHTWLGSASCGGRVGAQP